MIRNIVTLVVNDLAISFASKALFLIFFVPLFVVVSFQLTDRTDMPLQKMNIGIVHHEPYPPVIIAAIAAAGDAFAVSRVSLGEGRQRLKDGKLDGMLVASAQARDAVTLVVLKRESLRTASIIESFSALQKPFSGTPRRWIADIMPLQEGGAQQQTMPVWILMVVLLVSFITIPAQVAEEKERNLLVGLLQTPMRETEWLLAKLLAGLIFVNVAVVILHLPAGFIPENGPGYILFLEAGSYCFISLGILLGFLCRTQASARTAGVLCYMPLLIPAALSDFSLKLTMFAPFVPSYRFYNPLRSILLENSGWSAFSREWVFLLVCGTLALLFSRLLMKRRWLM